jgi:hypothetical protein
MPERKEWGIVRYVLTGGAISLAWGVVASAKGGGGVNAGFATAAAAFGAVVGLTMFQTRAWRDGRSPKRLLRWVVGGAAGGLGIALSGFMGNELTLRALALGAALGALFSVGAAMPFLSGEYRSSGDDSRTPRERMLEWGIWLGVALTVFALMLLPPAA